MAKRADLAAACMHAWLFGYGSQVIHTYSYSYSYVYSGTTWRLLFKRMRVSVRHPTAGPMAALQPAFQTLVRAQTLKRTHPVLGGYGRRAHMNATERLIAAKHMPQGNFAGGQRHGSTQELERGGQRTFAGSFW